MEIRRAPCFRSYVSGSATEVDNLENGGLNRDGIRSNQLNGRLDRCSFIFRSMLRHWKKRKRHTRGAVEERLIPYLHCTWDTEA